MLPNTVHITMHHLQEEQEKTMYDKVKWRANIAKQRFSGES